jgi:3-oxoacyl-[acyl-carrier protein] reductase
MLKLERRILSCRVRRAARTGWHLLNIGFAGRTVLVTGAGHGIGRAIARAFAERGATLWACDLNDEGLEETARLCGSEAHMRRVDVTDRDAVRVLGEEAAAASGRVDVLVNDAGGVLGQVGRPLEEIEPGDWRAIVDVNLSAPFWCAQAVAPAMKRAGGGRIVNISSGAGLGISLTGIQAYAAAKAGQIGLTRQLAHELGPFGITVNSVAPGFIRSNPTTERQWRAYGADGQRRLVEGVALKRLGRVEDIAHAVLFLASEFAGWITGQVLSVDGGK